MLRLGRRTFGAGQLLVMATGPSDLDEVDAAVAEGADLVGIGADLALVAAIRTAHPDLAVSVRSARRKQPARSARRAPTCSGPPSAALIWPGWRPRPERA